MRNKRNRIVTYRDRSRVQSVLTGIVLAACLIFGIYMIVAESNWIVLILAILGIGGLFLFIRSNEKAFKEEP
ncbi:hypothetical protein IWX75_003406 [Arthrobacter sp. CAN_A6]